LADHSDNGLLPRFCDYEGSDYRTAFWEGQGREYEHQAERIALRKLLPPNGERIIDIGGGFGRTVDLYSGYREIVLMDYSMTQLSDARSRLGEQRITYVAANVYKMPFQEGAFDAAVTIRVLHHLSDVPTALREIHGILQPGAAFVMEYANKRHLKAMLRYILRRQRHSPFDHQPWEFAELNFNFHPAYIEQHLESAGFRIERQLAVSHFRLGLLKRLAPARMLAAADSCLQQPLSALKWTPSIFLHARRSAAPLLAPANGLFRCPQCSSTVLQTQPGALRCAACSSLWSTEQGIYDFRRPVSR
jgi:ubiquinone/menaquinone biosynthesis C-methylase UbiE